MTNSYVKLLGQESRQSVAAARCVRGEVSAESDALTSVTEKSTVILWLLGAILFSMNEIKSLDGVSTCLLLAAIWQRSTQLVVGAIASKRGHSSAPTV